MENKQKVLNKLCECLVLTRAGSDIESITYIKRASSTCKEFAVITFKRGYTLPVDITADSGIAMIKNVVKAL